MAGLGSYIYNVYNHTMVYIYSMIMVLDVIEAPGMAFN